MRRAWLLLCQLDHVAETTWTVTVDDSDLQLCNRFCNRDIVERVQQVVCFAFHDSSLLLETCNEAKETRKIVTLFYLD